MFAELGKEGAADDLAHRPGADGRSALDHAVRATRILSLLSHAIEQALVDDDAVLHPAVGDASQRGWDDSTTGTVDETIAELVQEAERLADRTTRVSAGDWQRSAKTAGQGTDHRVIDILWEAVDSAISELKVAEATLHEVRGAR